MATGLPDLEHYRVVGDAFMADINGAWYRFSAGLTTDLPLEDIYERHAALFDADVARAFLDAAPDATGDRMRSIRNLAAFSAGGAIDAVTRHDAQAIAEVEATLTVTVDGEAVPMRSVHRLIADEPDADRRHALDIAQRRVLDAELNPGQAELWDARHAAARALGAASYRALFERVLGVDMDTYAAQAERFLRDSEALFEREFDHLLREHAGVGLTGARASDVPRVMRAGDLDARFPDDAARVVLAETLRGLGIHPERQANIIFDTDERPTKDPRAFCSPVRIPGEVYLVISPTGGLDDYRTLFHEAGHAQHFGGMAGGLHFEFRHLGDNAVTETFAFLFEGLVHDPTWLGAMLGGRDHDDVMRHAGTTRLYYQRRYCAKFAYERLFHRDGPTGMASRYADMLTDATRVEWPEERFVTDIDDAFYVVAYLRAWALECGLRRHLVERFGRRWFASRTAGSLLRELWEDGQRLNAEELASELGLPQLDLTILTEDAAELIR